jgi:hypothetical protein
MSVSCKKATALDKNISFITEHVRHRMWQAKLWHCIVRYAKNVSISEVHIAGNMCGQCITRHKVAMMRQAWSVCSKVTITMSRWVGRLEDLHEYTNCFSTGAGFLRVLQFPLPILIPLTAPHTHHLSSRACTIGQLVANVPSGLSLTPPQGGELKKKKLNTNCFTTQSLLLWILNMVPDPNAIRSKPTEEGKSYNPSTECSV